MATVKGQNLRIFIGGKAIGAALECSLQVQVNLQQFSTKDDEGAWTKNRVVSLSWSLTANAVVVDDTELNAIGVAEIADLIGQTVQVELATTSGNQNRTQDGLLLGGKATVSDIAYTAQNRQRSTCRVTLTGQKNMLIDIRALMTSDGHHIVTSNGRRLVAAHEG